MVPRICMIFLGLGILSMVAGCAVDPAPYSISPYEGYRQHETSQGHQYGGGIDYERKMDEEERQYRRQRSAQERERSGGSSSGSRSRHASGIRDGSGELCRVCR